MMDGRSQTTGPPRPLIDFNSPQSIDRDLFLLHLLAHARTGEDPAEEALPGHHDVLIASGGAAVAATRAEGRVGRRRSRRRGRDRCEGLGHADDEEEGHGGRQGEAGLHGGRGAKGCWLG